MKNQRPYEILGVTSSSSQDEIKNAYRNLAKKHHPDLNPGSKDAEKKFKEIAGAYELIGSVETRSRFDRGEYDEEVQGRPGNHGTQAKSERGPFYHQTQQQGGRYSYSFGGMDDDILQSLFGRRGRGDPSGSSEDLRGQDVLYQMDVDFQDAVLGSEKEITLPTGKRLRVKIPAGIDTGSKLRFAGHGAPGAGKASSGDAFVEVHVKPSPLFKRMGNDLEVELPISLNEAILGGEVKTPTIDGSVILKIPPGVSAGMRLRVTGKGISSPNQRGDQYVVLKVILPTEVDADFKKAIESWSKRQSMDPREGWVGSRGGGK